MKYITFIPLIGGMAIANEQATGKKPEFVLSYDAFEKNESNLKSYWPDVKWHILDAETNQLKDNEELDYSDIDFVSSVCPCAGMSMMSSSRSADSETNNWLYKAADYILGTIKPKVYFGENAPGLYSDTNEKVLNKLRAYGEKYGYAFTIYKTDTRLHGIPQRRVRTFFFFWQGETCPIMEYYNNPSEKPFEQWILDKNTGTHSNDFGMTKEDILRVYPETIWLLETQCNNNYNEYVKFFYDYFDKGHRVLDVYSYITIENKWKEYIEWIGNYKYGNVPPSKNGKRTPLSLAEYRYDKIKRGLRFYSDVPVVYKEYTSALTGKNLDLIFHPTEFRTLSVRETMELMGLPKDFNITSGATVHMTQNVPVCTAKDMTEQAIKFINGELKMSKFNFIKQNNLQQKIDVSRLPEPRLPFEK